MCSQTCKKDSRSLRVINFLLIIYLNRGYVPLALLYKEKSDGRKYLLCFSIMHWNFQLFFGFA